MTKSRKPYLNLSSLEERFVQLHCLVYHLFLGKLNICKPEHSTLTVQSHCENDTTN